MSVKSDNSLYFKISPDEFCFVLGEIRKAEEARRVIKTLRRNYLKENTPFTSIQSSQLYIYLFNQIVFDISVTASLNNFCLTFLRHVLYIYISQFTVEIAFNEEPQKFLRILHNSTTNSPIVLSALIQNKSFLQR